MTTCAGTGSARGSKFLWLNVNSISVAVYVKMPELSRTDENWDGKDNVQFHMARRISDIVQNTTIRIDYQGTLVAVSFSKCVV